MTWQFQAVRAAKVEAADAGNQKLHDESYPGESWYFSLFCKPPVWEETFKSWFCWRSSYKDLQSAISKIRSG